MSEIEHYRKLLRYDQWANLAHLESLRKLEGEQGPELEAARKAYNHVLAAKRIWYSRARGLELPSFGFYPDFSIIEAEQALEEGNQLWSEYIEASDASELDRKASYTDTFGNDYTMTLRDILTHLSLHSAHHRGQTAIFLRHAGKTPADADYYIWPMAKA